MTNLRNWTQEKELLEQWLYGGSNSNDWAWAFEMLEDGIEYNHVKQLCNSWTHLVPQNSSVVDVIKSK